MIYVFIALSFTPFWIKPQKYIKKARYAESIENYEKAINYYKKCIRRFPHYSFIDSVYFFLINIYKDKGIDSLLIPTIEEFEKNVSKNSSLYPQVLYIDGRIREDSILSSEYPDSSEAIYSKIARVYKNTPWQDSAKGRIKYLNKIIKLPVGKVYRCEICGKLLKADKILYVKRKYKYFYLKKYHTKEIRRGRCYNHQEILVPVKQVIVCPGCGRIMGKKTKYIRCMRSERYKYAKVETVKSETLCSYCQAHQPTFTYIAKEDTPQEALRMLQNYCPSGNHTLLFNIQLVFDVAPSTMQQTINGWTYEKIGNGVYQFTLSWTTYVTLSGSIQDYKAIWEIDIYNRTITALNNEAQGFMY